MSTPNLRLVCHEEEFAQLLGEIALHHLDLVLAGQAAPRNPSLRLTSERFVDAPVECYGLARLVCKIERDRFPQNLNDLPALLPTGHSTCGRRRTTGLRRGQHHDLVTQVVVAART